MNGKRNKRYCDYTYMEVEKLLKDNWLIIPAGSVEQHSANLPLSVDMDISGAVGTELCETENMILAPPIVYGVRSLPNSGGGRDFPGTIFIRGDVYTAYTVDILSRYIESGADKILIINGHYENYAFLCEAAELLEMDCCRKIIVMNWWDILEDSYMDEVTDGRFSGWSLEHAGVVETALECYLRPELVRGIMYEKENIDYRNLYSRGINWLKSSSGALSSNIGAASEMGEEIFKEIISKTKKLIEMIERRN